MALDPEQSARLQAAKLRALADADAGPDDARAPAAFAGGAALLRPGGEAWVLVADEPERSLGRALAWVLQQGATSLELIADDGADVLARRASTFRFPIRVRTSVDRALVDVTPAPPAVPGPASAEAMAVAWALVEAGAEVVVEHGDVRGEVNGLEVARVVEDVGSGDVRIEVGVGRHDREAFAVLHGHRPTAEALDDVVGTVRAIRRPGQPAHPLNRLAAERWLRRWLVEDPSRIGAADLEPVEGTLPRGSVQDVAPAVAVGRDEAGRPLVVACSTGIDLDLVPSAADARLAHDPEARLVLVLPRRDDHPVTRRLAASLDVPAEIVPVADGWR